jgi:hypothetical protein
MQSAPATGAWAIIPAPPPAIGLHSYFVTGEQEEEQNPPGAFISERETIGQEQERVCETAASKLNHAQEKGPTNDTNFCSPCTGFFNWGN